jgi:acyl dehydratase
MKLLANAPPKRTNRAAATRGGSPMNAQDLAAKVGEHIGTSEWVEMTQEKVNMFADATGDHQFIHINEEAAKMTPFGGTIAHGFMTLSMIPYLSANSDIPRLDGIKMAVNYGGNKTRFINPVRTGKRIRGHWKLTEMVEKRPGQWQQTCEITIEIEGEDKPALICEWMTLFFV